MDGFGWLVVLILLLLFGKNTLATFVPAFNQPNAVPTPDGLPQTTVTGLGVTQNTTNPPSAQPPPWHQPCSQLLTPVSITTLPVQGAPIKYPVSTPIARPVATSTRETFTQVNRGY